MVVAALAATLTGAAPLEAGRFTLRGKVTRVVDGDTIDVRLSNGRRDRIRLIGI
jgi:endonuclease YncB( thermonuclease family)